MPPFAAWLTDRLPDLLASPLAARLGWTCLYSLWQGLAIAALLAIALRLVPRCSSAATNARYLLATAAVVVGWLRPVILWPAAALLGLCQARFYPQILLRNLLLVVISLVICQTGSCRGPHPSKQT